MPPHENEYPYAFSEGPDARERFPWLAWIFIVVFIFAVLWPRSREDDPRFTQHLFGGVEVRVWGDYELIELPFDECFELRGKIDPDRSTGLHAPRILLVNRSDKTQFIAIKVSYDDAIASDGMIILEPNAKSAYRIRPANGTQGISTWSVILRRD